MNMRMFKTGIVLLTVFLVTADVNAQKKPRTTGTRPARSRAGSGYGASSSGYTTNSAAGDTTKKKSGTATRASGLERGGGGKGTNQTGGGRASSGFNPVT